ncbi:hypothetical protein AB0M29_01400 [Streptomyces sp. NPDC051976]|uniref:hypothetical protein n=1 Tax=Streptomyces sp. NPDC051976 TaxID=3154947 RepID=UPI0034123C13
MRRHRFEPASLVFGLVLLGLTTAFALDAAGTVHLPPRHAVPLIAAGLLLSAATGIVTQAVRSVRGRRARRQPTP